MAIIRQIIPATGWYARYKEDGELLDVPLACWALLEDGQVCGLGAGDMVQNVEDIGTFSCYFSEAELKRRNKSEDNQP